MSKSSSNIPLDPMKAWRDWFVQSEREWSEAVTKFTKDDSVARAVGQEMNAALYSQQMMKQGMSQQMAMFNMPTHEQLGALGERLGRLEDAVARVEAAVNQMRHSASDTLSEKPPRTRKPDVTESDAAADESESRKGQA